MNHITESSSLHITDHYIWLPQEYKLPLEVNCEVICQSINDGFLPCFSKTQAVWGSKDCDALSWFLSPHRHDFTFRTELFKGFPAVIRPHPGFNLEVGKPYHVTCVIQETSATYLVNGEVYAISNYDAGTIPTDGYLGFAVYGKNDIIVKNIQVMDQSLFNPLMPREIVTGLLEGLPDLFKPLDIDISESQG